MRIIKFLIFIITISTQIIFSQGLMEDERHPFMGGKIAELEKIKLIETLDLDEETMVKFFSRRNTHQNNIHKLMNEKDLIIKKLEEKIDSEKETDYQQYIDAFIEIDKKIITERGVFLKSLNDIFTTKEIAKLLVFEKNFRNDIRHEIIKQGKRMKGRRDQNE